MTWDISIHYLKNNLNLRELELVEKYWEASTDKPRSFKYLIKNLDLEFQDILYEYKDNKKRPTSVTKYVSSFAFATSVNRKCKLCGESIKYFDRSLLQSRDYIFLDLMCKICAQQNAQDTLKKILISIDEAIRNLPQADYVVENLSYVEVIYLHILLSHISNNCKVNLHSLVVSEEFDEIVFLSLVNKKVLANYDDTNIELYRHLSDQFAKVKNHLPKDQQEVFYSLASKLPSPGLHFLHVPSTTPSEIHSLVLNKLLSINSLEIQDVREVESLANSLIVNKSLMILKSIESQFRIKIEKNIGLFNTLEYLVLNYSPRRICHVLHYVAKEISAGLYSRKFKANTQSRMYLKKLNDFLSFLNEHNNPVDYYRDLPPRVRPTLLEHFLCGFVLEGILYLDNIKGRDLIRLWVMSPNVKEGKLNLLTREHES